VASGNGEQTPAWPSHLTLDEKVVLSHMPSPKGHQHDVALDELDCTTGHAYLTGSDILLRLPAIQRKLDAAAGHNTAG
jgi:hypothetical protein